MKVYAISDLHMSTTEDKPMDIFGMTWTNYMEEIFDSWQSVVSDEDIVLICGDISWAMKLDNAIKDLCILSALKGKKLLIRGNHDYWWNGISKVRDKLPNNFFALQNDAIRLEGIVFCGCRGWVVPSAGKKTVEDERIYARELIRMDMALSHANKIRCQDDCLITMIHYPPFDTLRNDSGFTDLFVKYNVQKVVYGHLHGDTSRCDTYIKKSGIEYYLTSCDKVNNKLVLIHE